jgi:hypothetical protein
MRGCYAITLARKADHDKACTLKAFSEMGGLNFLCAIRFLKQGGICLPRKEAEMSDVDATPLFDKIRRVYPLNSYRIP